MTNVTSTRGLDVDRVQEEPSSGELGWGFSSLVSLSFPLWLSHRWAISSTQEGKQDGGAAGHSGVGLWGTRDAGLQAAHFTSRNLLSFPTCRMG